MKVLHTADWHLGKRLDGFSRFEEQIEVMNEIVEIANREKVDLVLIAGDLFDAFNPAVDAVDLFYKTLKQLTNNAKRPVIAIAGNHDSPDRINAPDPLARECGIILLGYPNEKVNLFELDHFKITKSVEGFIELKINHIEFPIRIIHTPYANEMRLKQYFGEEKEAQLNLVLKEQWTKIADEFCDEKGVNLLLSHLYMNKRGTALLEEPEGEKPIKIGNADMVFSDCVPPQIQYTALGHLHAFNNIGTSEKPIVYASSPLCYSFSEAGQTKYVSIINAKPNQDINFTKVTLTKGKALIRKTFQLVDDAINWLLKHPDTLVELTMETDTFLTTDERKAIFQAHSGIVHLIPRVKNVDIDAISAKEINLNQDIKGLFKDYFKSKNAQQEPNQELMDLFNEILNE
ncbi:metallophosphoesterase family protein [Paenimyroides aestuarii]|uniref:Nuclease SbcCD subunit D n=1 Tax=Paenimyroides aestuarii TaxID=2968490 RepID=A0ABY5NV34_9FLAO|nr:exonuclease subunit SbcD [Paenimyroides aestuarii]UUV22448.1 exonuclease subunit SbcD [Paenimyroides aestuarii]